MPTATRFTTRYEMSEDRVKLSLELPDDNVQILWMTRRLLSRMVPHLLDRLQGIGPIASGPTETQQQAMAGNSDAVQRFNQEAAVSAIARQPAVTPSEKTPAGPVAYLITSIDVRSGPQVIVLDFKSGERVLHSLPLGEDALRQWLSIVYSQYKAGGWNEAFWPNWIHGPEATNRAKDGLLLN